ncbi:MAG: hypothetical protein ABI479_11000 [Gallionella sp.]
MKTKHSISIALFVILVTDYAGAYAAEPHAETQAVKLSPELLNLLRSEMREITGGVQAMAFSISTADWKSIQETSAKIRASYIMERKLTPTQAKELEALPERFRKLDASFHQRAEKVGAAAQAHDAELVTYQYSRLLESCVVCHAGYAKSRFPSFSSPIEQAHHH